MLIKSTISAIIITEGVIFILHRAMPGLVSIGGVQWPVRLLAFSQSQRASTAVWFVVSRSPVRFDVGVLRAPGSVPRRRACSFRPLLRVSLPRSSRSPLSSGGPLWSNLGGLALAGPPVRWRHRRPRSRSRCGCLTVSPGVSRIGQFSSNSCGSPGSASMGNRSWWSHTSAGLPAGPVWLWASPRSGLLWPWSVGLLAVRRIFRRVLWWVRPRLTRARARRAAWIRRHPVLFRRSRAAWRMLGSLVAPLLAGFLGL